MSSSPACFDLDATMVGDSRASSSTVRFHVGPLPSNVALEWITNRRSLIERARRADGLSLNHDALDLLDTYLELWEREASGCEVFDWTHDFDASVFLLVASYWLVLGEIRPDQRAAIGVPAPPQHTEVVTHAIVVAMVDGLRSLGGSGVALLDRLNVASTPTSGD